MRRRWVTASVYSFVFFPLIAATAPLEPTSWTEFIRLYWDFSPVEWRGQDDASPEPLVHSISSPCGSVNGNVTFGPPGPPFVTAHSEVGPFTCYLPGMYKAVTDGAVTFQFRIIEMAAPPVEVQYVPLMIALKGNAAVYGRFGAAIAVMNVRNGETQVFEKRSDVTYDTGPISLDATETISIEPGAVLTGSMQVYAVAVGGITTASIGIALEIASDVIPGTASQYRDFFEIEYSPGYWALGNSTPVHATTWGKIKSFYRD